MISGGKSILAVITPTQLWSATFSGEILNFNLTNQNKLQLIKFVTI